MPASGQPLLPSETQLRELLGILEIDAHLLTPQTSMTITPEAEQAVILIEKLLSSAGLP